MASTLNPASSKDSAATVSKTGATTSVRQAVLVAGAAIGLAAGFSGLYFSTLAIFLKPIAHSFGWGRAETSAVSVMSMLGFAVGAPLLGTFIDRLGARRLIGGSMVLFAASLAMLSIMPGSYALFAAASLLTGLLGVGTGPSGYMAVLPRVFDKRLGLALSLSMVGAGVGASVLPVLTQGMVTSFGWRHAYQGLALIALVAGVLAYVCLGVGQGGAARTAGHARALVGSSLSEALRDRRFWTLIGVVFVATAGGLGAVVHVAALFTDRGLSPTEAAQIAAFSGIGLMLGRFLAGLLMDVVFAPLVATTGFLLGALGLLVIGLQLTTAFPMLAFSSLLFGFALGAEGDFAAFAVRRYFGTRSFGAIYGAVITAYSLGGVAGPVLFGIGFDRLGDYRLVLATAAIAYVLTAAAVLTLGRYRWPRGTPLPSLGPADGA